MTEVAEPVSVDLPTVGKDQCPICEKAPHPQRTTTAKKEGKGCLASIPANLGCAQLPIIATLPNYATAAHHLIPANQCLKPFKRLSQMCDTVGYDVNNSNNGMPLPTCGQQALNSYQASSGQAVKYGELNDADKNNAAFQIMAGLNLQWHVGHHDWALDLTTDDEVHPPNYDQLVKRALRQLEKDARQAGDAICEESEESEASESGSELISELNALSAKIKGQVIAWKLYYVSTRSYKFASKYRNT